MAPSFQFFAASAVDAAVGGDGWAQVDAGLGVRLFWIELVAGAALPFVGGYEICPESDTGSQCDGIPSTEVEFDAPVVTLDVGVTYGL